MRCTAAVAVGLAVVVLAPATAARAQDAEWTTWSKVELPGALGTMARLFGGNMESLEKTYVKGGMMRTDMDRMSSIVDLENGRFMSIDHEAKTYTLVTMADLAAFASSMQQQSGGAGAAGAGGAAGAAPQADAAASGQPGDSVEVKLDLKVDRPGEKQKIMGYDAERVFVTFTSEFLVTPEGEEQAQQAGTLVIFMDSWNASGVPAEEAQKRMAESVGPELRSQSAQMAGTFMSAFSSDPKARAAVEEAAAEADKLAGFELKGTMHIVLVPPGLTFERDQVLGDGEGGGGAGGAVKRGLGGLLRSAAGVDRDESNSEDPKQGTIARVRTEVREMKTGEVPASLFEPPAGYREIVFGAGG